LEEKVASVPGSFGSRVDQVDLEVGQASVRHNGNTSYNSDAFELTLPTQLASILETITASLAKLRTDTPDARSRSNFGTTSVCYAPSF